jgi:hypothetical protein
MKIQIQWVSTHGQRAGSAPFILHSAFILLPFHFLRCSRIHSHSFGSA